MLNKHRFIAILLILSLAVLPLLAGCSSGTTVNPVKRVESQNVWNALLFDVPYEEELQRVSLPDLFFSGLPEGSTVLLAKGSGYYADEAGMITLPSDESLPDARKSVEIHLEELRSEFSKYNPEQLDKIDHVVMREFGNVFLFCVTADYQKAAEVLDQAIKDPDYKPSRTENTEPVSTEAKATEEVKTEPVPVNQKDQINPGLYDELYQKRTDVELNDKGYPKLVSKSGTYHYYSKGGVFRVDNAAFEPHYYSENVAKAYAEAVSRCADELSGKTDVYSILIPTSFAITLPDDIAAKLPSYTDVHECMQSIYSMFEPTVKAIDLYPILMNHRDEYLYFRTDHHWAQRAAYYAYSAFCYEKGIRRIAINAREVKVYSPYLGSFYWNNANQDPQLLADDLEAIMPIAQNATMQYTDKNGAVKSQAIIENGDNYGPRNKYLIFAAADQPYAVFKNPDITDGSVCIFVKESFGNCLVPFLVDHYQTVYEIDYRYWNGDLTDFAESVNATDLIFANNTSMTRNANLVSSLNKII